MYSEAWKGNIDALNKIIIEHLPLAKTLANKFIRISPHYKDAFISAAYWGLVKGTHKFFSVEYQSDYIPYIVKTIINECYATWNECFPIHIPRTSKKRLTQVSLEWRALTHISEQLHKFMNLESLIIEDILKSWNLPKEDETIIQLRIEGYTLHEIGEILNKNYVWIYRELKKIQGIIHDTKQEIF